MPTYTVILTATFEADDAIDASEQFSYWLTDSSNVENGVDISIDVDSAPLDVLNPPRLITAEEQTS